MGQVGQMDWKAFSNVKNQNIDFGFSAVQQSLINRIDGNNPTNIINNIKPAYGVNTSKITTDNLKKTDNVDITYTSGQNSNIDLSNNETGAMGQANWKDASVEKNQKVDFGFSAVPQRTIERIDNSKLQIIIEPQK